LEAAELAAELAAEFGGGTGGGLVDELAATGCRPAVAGASATLEFGRVEGQLGLDPDGIP